MVPLGAYTGANPGLASVRIAGKGLSLHASRIKILIFGPALFILSMISSSGRVRCLTEYSSVKLVSIEVK